MRRAVALLAVLLIAAAPPPPASPPLVPTRDALIAYHVAPGGGEPFDVAVVQRAGGVGMRIDLPDQSYMLVTPPRSLVMVVPAQKTAVDLPWGEGPQALFVLDSRMTFIRKAEATVAGQRCTVYDATLDRLHSMVCVTPDGLMLRSTSLDPLGRRNLIEAIALRYETLPLDTFVVPLDFERLGGPGRRTP